MLAEPEEEVDEFEDLDDDLAIEQSIETDQLPRSQSAQQNVNLGVDEPVVSMKFKDASFEVR